MRLSVKGHVGSNPTRSAKGAVLCDVFAEAAPFFRCYPGSGFGSGTKSRLLTSVSAELSFAV